MLLFKELFSPSSKTVLIHSLKTPFQSLRYNSKTIESRWFPFFCFHNRLWIWLWFFILVSAVLFFLCYFNWTIIIIIDDKKENATFAFDVLNKVPGLKPIKPSGAMYIMVSVSQSLSSFCQTIREKRWKSSSSRRFHHHHRQNDAHLKVMLSKVSPWIEWPLYADFSWVAVGSQITLHSCHSFLYFLLSQVGIDMEKFPHFSSDLQLIEGLVSEESVFCLPGQCFDFPNFMRVVLTVPKELTMEACNRMASFFTRHYVSSPEKTKATMNGRQMNGCDAQVEDPGRLIINLPPVAGTWQPV